MCTCTAFHASSYKFNHWDIWVSSLLCFIFMGLDFSQTCPELRSKQRSTSRWHFISQLVPLTALSDKMCQSRLRGFYFLLYKRHLVMVVRGAGLSVGALSAEIIETPYGARISSYRCMCKKLWCTYSSTLGGFKICPLPLVGHSTAANMGINLLLSLHYFTTRTKSLVPVKRWSHQTLRWWHADTLRRWPSSKM